MKQFGIAIVIIGILMAVLAFNSDTSVAVEDYTGLNGGERVSNLAKINQQQSLIQGSCALCLIGTVLFVGGTVVSKIDDLRFSRTPKTAQAIKSTLHELEDEELTPAHAELKARYERSEISLEDYAREWNRLS